MSTPWRLLAAMTLCLAGQARAADGSLAGRAQVLLAQHCYECHGRGGSAKGGLGFILDREQLVGRGLLVPGKPAESDLYKKLAAREMPPPSRPKLQPAQVELLRDWIAAGAPALPRPPRSFLGPGVVARFIENDLHSFSPRQRRFLRYASFAHLHDAGRPESELETASQALSKLLNSLSWHARVSRPAAIDPSRSVFRIDLRDYRWTARSWERLATVYPYRQPNASDANRACADMTGTATFCVRGDWLIATASRGKLYYDLLEMPGSDKGLERLLQVEVARGFQEETVLRAGFNGSGVSKNNRVLERHDAAHGAFWRSHDFSDNTDRQNIFENPLGPLAGKHSFRPAGGEIIFHLPNGMQGYLLVDAGGQRIEKGPIEIVSDPGRPDKQVEVGLSCMNCHGKGLIPKDDQIRAHVEKNAAAFPRAVVDAVRALYVPARRFRTLLDGDNARYLAALQAAGVPTEAPDPVTAVTLRYEGVLDLALAGGELGLPGEELAKQLTASPSLQRLLGPLQARGTVQRQIFEEKHAQIVANVKAVAVVQKEEKPRKLDLPPAFEGHTAAILCLCLTSDDRLALSGGQDQTVRLWDVSTGNLHLTLEGHTAAVHGVACSADGKRALSCSSDRTVRLWDLASQRLLMRLNGHLDRVSTVAFSADGRLALSGSHDRTVRVWDLTTGKLLHVLGHAGAVNCVAFSPDSRLALSGGADGSVRLWDLKSGQEKAHWDGHRRGVHCVCFSPDGKQVASGGEDRVIRLWDVAGGRAIRTMSGHVNAPLSVRFSRDGRRLFSASGQNQTDDRFLRIWDVGTGREIAGRGGNGSVWCAVFSSDGRSALTAGTGKRLERWVVEFPER